MGAATQSLPTTGGAGELQAGTACNSFDLFYEWQLENTLDDRLSLLRNMGFKNELFIFK